MNKYLTGAALATVLAFAGAAEAKHDGFFTGAKVGYSYSTAKITTQTAKFAGVNDAIQLTGETKGKSGFHGTVFVGHGTKVGNGYFAAALNASFDSAKVKMGTFEMKKVAGPYLVGDTGNFTYEPGFGLGLEGRGGVHFGENHKYLVFFKLGLDYNFGKFVVKDSDGTTYKDSAKVWSVTPGLGVQGEINDHMNWTAGVDYKMAFSVKKANITNLIQKKPKTFVVNAGLTYHF